MKGEPCPVCDGDQYRLRYEAFVDYEYHVDIHPDILECISCGLLRHREQADNNRLRDFYPADYLVYNQSFKSVTGSFFATLKKMLYTGRARKMAAHIGGNAKVLDIGCANGALLSSLRERGNYDLYGIDIKNTGVDFASLGISFREGILEEACFESDYFDAIAMDNVIEHVSCLKSFITEVYRILKPGGWIFCTTPNHASLDRLVFHKYWGGFHMPRHTFLFNSSNIRLFLKKNGFDDIRLLPTFNAGDWAVSVQNFMRRNSGRQISYTRGAYFPVVGLLLAPVSFITSLFGFNGVMDLCCRKSSRPG